MVYFEGKSSGDADMTASQAIADIIQRQRIQKLGYLPCDKLKWLFERLRQRIPVWHLTRESAGVALACGWALGQGRPALLIQSTGLGNLITELMTLPVLYGLPLPLLVSWRGHYKENIEAQSILGERVVPMLRGLEIPVAAIETPEDLAELDGGISACFEQSKVQVFLLSPRLWEGEDFEGTPEVGNPRVAAVHLLEEGFEGAPQLARYQAIEVILESLAEDEVLLAQIGFPARETYALKDRERNLYLLGALGSATLVGIGLAEARPDLKIVVLDGDGAFLLNPNQMFELSQTCPKNLSVVLLDNGAWGSTGSQPTLTSRGLNLAAFGASVGTPKWNRVVNASQWQDIRSRGGQLAHFLIRPGNADVPTIPIPAKEMTRRFQRAISQRSSSPNSC
jgi:sulfopyruvate decarboxylase alpha subunit